MFKINSLILSTVRWLAGRVAMIYIIIFVFTFSCLDLKVLNTRIKVRHLNQAVPNFADMINFSMGVTDRVDWGPYERYFRLILSYMPADAIAKQLLGYVDFYAGHKEEAVLLFKDSAEMNGHYLLWPNYNLGVLYYQKGEWSRARDYLLKAIASNSELNLLIMRDAVVYKQILDSPVFSYDLQEQINEIKGNAYILLLSCLYHQGEYGKMIGVAEFGLKNQHLFSHVDFYYYAGLGCYEKGRLHDAFLFFQKSLEANRDNPDVYFYIANIYRRAGQTQEAENFLKLSYLLHRKNDPRFPYERAVTLRFF